MNWRFIVLAVVALAVGFGGAVFFGRAKQDKKKNELHARLAALRTYEEGYALRNGHYVLLPDSCAKPDYSGWKTLGTTPPPGKIGCFRVESAKPYPGNETAPSMRIIASSAELGLEAVEGDTDSAPTWRSVQP